jgi:sulfur transfer complex TusBCD TusB component (DsrH family)
MASISNTEQLLNLIVASLGVFLLKNGVAVLLKTTEQIYTLNDVDIFLFFCHRSYDQLRETQNEGMKR